MSDIPSIPHSDVAAWLIAPAGRCVEFVTDQLLLGALIRQSLIAFAGYDRFIVAARELAALKGREIPELDQLLRDQQALAPLAHKVSKTGFHDINVSVLVSLWSAVEVATEDTLVLLLLKDPSTVATLAAAGIDVSKQLSRGTTEDSARSAWWATKRRLRRNHDAGSTLVEALKACGLGVEVPDSTKAKLAELGAVRNCLLHRAGLADSRLVSMAPALGLTVGDTITVSPQLIQSYLEAVRLFAVELTGVTAKRATELLA